MPKPDSKLVKTPVDFIWGTPDGKPSGSVKTDGEPGQKQRTSSPNAFPEVTYDRNTPPKG